MTTELDPARREELAEVLTNEHAEGWYTASEHDPGCPGDESYCMSHCPVPVQARTGPDGIADALAPLIASWLADARAEGAAEALQEAAHAVWPEVGIQWGRSDIRGWLKRRAALTPPDTPPAALHPDPAAPVVDWTGDDQGHSRG